VDEDDPAKLPENDVRVPGQVVGVKPVSISKGEDEFADKQLGPRVLGPHPRHDL
jgi:hypothetical protein